MPLRKDYDTLADRLKTERDELNVQMHLASADLRDEWHILEDRWDDFQHKLKRANRAASESADEIGAALELLGQELKEGYKNIRKAMH